MWLFDFFAMDPMFNAVFHACRGGHRPGVAWNPMTGNGQGGHCIKIMHDSLFSSHLRLCPCVR